MAFEAQLGKNSYGYRFGSSEDRMGSSSVCFWKQEQLLIPEQEMYRDYFEPKNREAVALSRDVVAQVEEQSREVDRLIMYQNERLRLIAQEQLRKQMESILKNAEAKVEILMKQKDQEIANALNRKLELENFHKRMEIECKKWQRAATENESMVERLNNTIEQYREINYYTMNQVDDSESCCDRENEAEENKNICKYCNLRNSRVILLPCRHLCCCKYCEGFLVTCPKCGILKKASIEALF